MTMYVLYIHPNPHGQCLYGWVRYVLIVHYGSTFFPTHFNLPVSSARTEKQTPKLKKIPRREVARGNVERERGRGMYKDDMNRINKN